MLENLYNETKTLHSHKYGKYVASVEHLSNTSSGNLIFVIMGGLLIALLNADNFIEIVILLSSISVSIMLITVIAEVYSRIRLHKFLRSYYHVEMLWLRSIQKIDERVVRSRQDLKKISYLAKHVCTSLRRYDTTTHHTLIEESILAIGRLEDIQYYSQLK